MILFFAPSAVAQVVFEGERTYLDFTQQMRNLPSRLNGYVKHEMYYDTRQVEGLCNEQYLYFPKRIERDPDGSDINAAGNFYMVAVESRLRFEWQRRYSERGEFFGVLEADFFTALSEAPIGFDQLTNFFRLRHAYLKITTPHTEFFAGQAWHPINVLDCYPDTISFNGGAPIDASTRNPLVLAVLHQADTQLILGAISQIYSPSDGPIGISSTYMGNAKVPELHVQLKKRGKEHIIGTGYDVKRLRPRIRTDLDYATRESIWSSCVFLYYSFLHPVMTFCAKYLLIQNGNNDLSTIGGYGVHSIDPLTDRRTYANISASNFWIDCSIEITDRFQPGFFVGHAYNLGSYYTILPDLIIDGEVVERRSYGIGLDIAHLVRVSPRLRIKFDAVLIGLELEMTAAAYGKRNDFAQVRDGQWAKNMRLLCAFYYIF